MEVHLPWVSLEVFRMKDHLAMNTGPALPTVDTRQNFFSVTATKVVMYTQMKHQTES